MIGRWLKRDPAKRDKVVIATKVGFLDGEMVDGEYVAALEPKALSRPATRRCRRLGVDTIDLYYQHKDNENVPLADSLGAFDALAKAGKIRAIGLSQFTAGAARRSDGDVATATACCKPSCAAAWYNMVERDEVRGRAARRRARATASAIFPFYSLANGFLTGKYRRKEDLDKSPRGMRNVEYLEGKARKTRLDGARCVSRPRPARRWRRSHSPGPWPSRGSPPRSPARPVSSS